MLYTLEEILKILIFRFKCKHKACNRTLGLLPPFVERYQSAPVGVQDDYPYLQPSIV